jgi:hypothetical protein
MASDAGEVLGSPQLAGVKVNPRGMAKSKSVGMSGMYAGVIGAAAGAAAGMRAEKKQAQMAAESVTPKFGRLAYLAVTAEEVALIEMKLKGMVGLELHDVIVRVPRSEVASAELGGGGLFSPPLTITFTNGGTWQLEVPRPSKKHAKEVVQTLAG